MGGEDHKKGFRPEMNIISAVYCCISIIEKEKNVEGRMTVKGRRPGKMPWRASSGPRAAGCRPLVWSLHRVWCRQVGQVAAWLEARQVSSLFPSQGKLVNKM